MRRGTSPYVKITCGQDWSKFKNVIFTMRDTKGNQLDINIDDFDFETDEDGNTVMYSQLSQEDTLMFCPKSKLKVQLRILDEVDNAYSSPIFTMSIDDVLMNRAIGEPGD